MGRNRARNVVAWSTVAAMTVVAIGVVPASAAATLYSAKAAVHVYVRDFQLGADGSQQVLADTIGATGAVFAWDQDGAWNTKTFPAGAGDLTINADGDTVVVLRSEYSGLIAVETWHDGVWSEDVVHPATGSSPKAVRLVYGPDGTAHLATGGATGVAYRTKPVDGAWSDPIGVVAATKPTTFGDGQWDLVVDDAGVPHVVIAGSYPTSPIGAPCVVDDGCVVDMTPDGADGWVVEPISSAVGGVDAIFTTEAGLELTTNDSGRIRYVGKVNDEWVTQDVYTGNASSSIVRGSSGPVIIFTPGSASLRRADRTGSTWSNTTMLTANVSFPFAEIDENDGLHVAYGLVYNDPTLGSTSDAYVRAPDDVAPTVGAPTVKGKTNAVISSTIPSTISWAGGDSQSGIDHYQLQQRTDGGSWSTVSSTLTGRSATRNLSRGRTYEFRVRGYDRSGHVSSWKQGLPIKLSRYQEGSSRIVYSGTWKSSTSSSASGGKTKYSKSAAGKARITFTGQSFAWVAPRSSSRGRADVWVDGVFVAEVDTYRAKGLSKVIVYSIRWLSPGTHTVEIRNLAVSGRPRIDVDAFVIGR